MNYLKRKNKLKKKVLETTISKDELKELYYLIRHYGSERELDELLQSGWNAEESATAKMDEKTSQKVLVKIRSSVHKQSQRSFLIRRTLKVAASISLLALSLFVLRAYYLNLNQTDEVAMVVREAAIGKVSKVTLKDGTVIWLNSGSKISYPENFKEHARTVELQGEAFFEVARDESRPFTIKSGEFTTQVLGTSFNISAYKAEPYAVTVATGKVKVMYKADAVLLTKDQRVDFDSTHNKFISSNVTSGYFSDWRHGITHLNGKLLEAFKVIERKYGVTVLFENPKLQTCEIDATYKNEALINILNSIEFSMGVKAAMHNDTIKISGKSCYN